MIQLLLLILASYSNAAPMIYHQYQWYSPVYFYQPSNYIDQPLEKTVDDYPEICNDSELTLIPHPDDCSKYYFCWKGNEAMPAILMTCPFGTYFDPSMNVCNWQGNVQCHQDTIPPSESRAGEIDLRIGEDLIDEVNGNIVNNEVSEATDVIEVIKEKIEEVKEETKDNLEEIVKEIQDEVEEKVEEVQEDTNDVMEKVDDIVKEIQDEVEEKVEEVKEDIIEKIETTDEDGQDAIENLEEVIMETKDDIEEIVDEVKETVKQETKEEATEVETETEENRDPKGEVAMVKDEPEELTTVGFVCRAAWCLDDFDDSSKNEDKELEAAPTATANEDIAAPISETAATNEGVINEELEDTTSISVDGIDLEEEDASTDAPNTEY